MASCNCGNITNDYQVKKDPNNLTDVESVIITDVASNPRSMRDKKIGDLFDGPVNKVYTLKSTYQNKTKACEIKNTLKDGIKGKMQFAKTGNGLITVNALIDACCKEIGKEVSPDQECADKYFGGDLDKLKEKRKECKNNNQKFSCRSGKCYTPSTKKDTNVDPDPIAGCMDSEAVNYVKGATTPTQCEYEIEVPLLNEYVFCNEAGCLDKTPKNTITRDNTILIRPTGGLSPYQYVEEIKNEIYEVIKDYENALYPINGIGFYSEDKNNYLHDLATALTLMLIKNKSQLEDYDNFPYKYVSVYGGGMGVPYGTVKLTINDNWQDNLKTVVTGAKIFNAKNNFTKLLQIASNNNLSFDLDFLENTFKKDVQWLNDNIKNNGYIVSANGLISLLEHQEGLGTILNEDRKPIGLVNILK